MTPAEAYYATRAIVCLEEVSRNYHKLARRVDRAADPFIGEHTTDWATCMEEPCVQHRALISSATDIVLDSK